VFITQDLAKGTYRYRGVLIEPALMTQTALLTIEGERDDITGPGQTEAAHGLCSGVPPDMKAHHLQKGVGHYGVFSGKRFRSDVVPVISQFIAAHSER
jgi:poly(3-hydroxybutyrate) depolymerase